VALIDCKGMDIDHRPGTHAIANYRVDPDRWFTWKVHAVE
jgi:hypothetical protein